MSSTLTATVQSALVATVKLNGTTIWYDVVGSGPPALVLHGGLGLDHPLSSHAAPLEQRLRLVHLDHRGNGRSSRPALETITIEQLADDAALRGSSVTIRSS